ncbi:MAG: hypothetical protein JSW17_04260 [Candidatus Omnitrophota bacterium]|nr:MAG: hypothetical protein JSW17_04260 [Candidatus Omnitrophota bacterium]
MLITSFPEIEQILKERIKAIDYQSFEGICPGDCRKLFSECYGMCCSLYVGLTQEEADVLKKLAIEKAEEFRKIGVKLPEKVVVYDPQSNRNYLNKRRRSFGQLAGIVHTLLRRAHKNYPLTFKLFKDFTYTCVFSLDSGDCALQRLALAESHHPWYYKPLNCWKYPLSINNGILSVFDREVNPCFPCNQDNKSNGRAVEVLKEELAFLGKIIERDLISELNRD